MKKRYFDMEPSEQQLYRRMLWRQLQSKFSDDIVHDRYQGHFADWVEEKMEQMELNEMYEELQAIIDYFENDN